MLGKNFFKNTHHVIHSSKLEKQSFPNIIHTMLFRLIKAFLVRDKVPCQNNISVILSY